MTDPGASFPLPPTAGTYYPRIYRGAELIFCLEEETVRTQTGLGVQLLLEDLRAVFTVVTPDAANLDTYGPRIRQLLMLACTEVEAGWGGVLRENRYPSDRLTTRDYIKLARPLLLHEYGFGLRDYPGYPWFSPFSQWDASKPTDSIPWYAANNRTKHNREAHLSDATLERTIAAIAAAISVACAQFGTHLFLAGGRFAQNVFNINGPSFRLSDRYAPPESGGSWRRVPYPFGRD